MHAYTPTRNLWMAILAVLLAAAVVVVANPQPAGAGPSTFAASVYVEGNGTAPCTGVSHGQFGDCKVIVHSGLSAGDTLTVKVWTDATKTTLVSDDSVTSNGGLVTIAGGGITPGHYVELITPTMTYTITAPVHMATFDPVNNTVSGVTADGDLALNIIQRAATTDDTQPVVCGRILTPDADGAWTTDYGISEDINADHANCTVETWDIKPGDWLQIANNGVNPFGDIQLSIWVPEAPDVDPNSTHAENIAQMAIEGITLGCDAEGNYCPDDGVRRDQMASFLDRGSKNSGLYALLGGGGGFTDVVAGSTHAAAIDAVAAAGITLGCNPEGTLYCPADLVTRAQMATFLARALGLTPVADNRFGDVVTGSTHAGNINAVADAGITLGCDSAGTMFCPDDVVTRAQMASFIIRALNAGG